MFEINHFSQNELKITELKDLETDAKIQILPSAGALWHGWRCKNKGQEINLIDHYKDKEDLIGNLLDSHKGANLNPFACRIPEGKYKFEGRSYEFKNKFKDGSAIHGLVKNKIFKEGKVNRDDEKISVSFEYSYRHEDEGYPFDYNCTVTYVLYKDLRVSIDTRVDNVSDQVIPVVDGWHPYFTTGSEINNCQLQFSSKEMIEFDNRLIPTGKLLPYTEFEKTKRIGDTELDHSFLLDQEKPQPLCTFSDPNKNIKIYFYPSKSYPVLQIYTPPHRKSIAIESLSGAPDAFNNGIGLILLYPKETKTFSVTYEAAF